MKNKKFLYRFIIKGLSYIFLLIKNHKFYCYTFKKKIIFKIYFKIF